MERYNEYKDSGVQWLGEIPSHWEVKRLASYFIERRTKVSDKDYEPLSVTKNGIFPQLENVAKTNDGDNRKLVLKGDFVINSRSDRKGSSGVSKYDGSVSLINIVLNPRSNVIPDYCNYILKGYSFIEEYYRNGRGIVADLWTTRYDEMKTIKICMPPVIEQQAIVSYLDTATAKIDEAIAQQQKMIDLLNERKQIIINNAVTKGLNPDAPMKDSGVDWIGEIPEHWEFVRLKRYCKVRTGKTPSTTKEYYFENGDIKWFTPGDLNKFELVDSERKVTYRAQLEQACNMFPANTVYLVGIGGTIGKVGVCETEATCNQQINAIIPNGQKINHKYLAHLIQSTKVQILRLANFSTLPIINQDRTGTLNIVVPPISEQESIVNILENKSAPINAAIKAAEKQISLLQERKQIIINDVVTGKVKVS